MKTRKQLLDEIEETAHLLTFVLNDKIFVFGETSALIELTETLNFPFSIKSIENGKILYLEIT